MAKGYLQDVGWVDFYGRPIVTAYSDDHGYVVPMKHIVEDHLGLDWKTQRKKINATTEVEDPEGNPEGCLNTPLDKDSGEVYLYNPVKLSGYDLNEALDEVIDLPEDAPEFLSNQEYVCLPLSELNMFLCEININRVNIAARPNLYRYKKECMSALHDYWMRGYAINTRKNPSRISSDRHEFCPREQTSAALEKGCQRYAAYAQRVHDSRLNPEEIFHYCQTVICQIMDIEAEDWDSNEGASVFTLAYMERAAFDILYFAINGNVTPDELSETLDDNIRNAWESMGTLILSIQSPYSAFPGVGRGAPRELI